MSPILSSDRGPSARGFSQFFRLLVLGLFAFATVVSLRAGFSVQNGVLHDAKGNKFVMRGINHPHVWYTSQTATSIPAIAATGANSVRIVLGNGKQWGPTSQSELSGLIALCKANKLIAVPEVHDCTGYGDTGGYAPSAAPLSTAVDYWISVKGALVGQEDYVILNIANEPFGNGVSASTYINEHKTAIARLRAAGLTHTLMVDAANWGQDWEGLMLNNATEIFNADPLKNTIFSVHMYEVYQQDSVINSYMTSFAEDKLVLLVGEFAATHKSSDVNEGAIMSRCQQYGLGYLGWSWSGNSSDLAALDIVSGFNASSRTSWGNTLISGSNGIASTSTICTVFNADPTTLSASPTTFSLAAVASSGTATVTSNASWSVSDDQTWLSTSATSGSGNGTFTISATANSGTSSRSGTVTITAGSSSVAIAVTQAGTATPADPNRALNRPVVVSSTESSALSGSQAVDGNASTRWSSAYSDPQWLQVDLGATYAVNRVVLNWETAYASGYRVEVSADASSWTSVYSTTNGDGGTDDLSLSGTGRYVRIYGTARATVWGYSLWELQVYGTLSGTTVPVGGVTLSPSATSVTVGSSVTLTATVLPSTATNKAVTWSSNNTGVASVSSAGVVTGVAAGTATITVKTTDGNYTASTLVTVTGPGGGTNPTPITVPFVKDGVADAYYVFTSTFNHINSWNVDVLTINGVSYKGQWVTKLPASADGKYVVHYVASVPWGHFEVK